MIGNFSAEEERGLRERVASGCVLLCPRCKVPMSSSVIPPRDDVSYVRTRTLLQCAACDLRCVVDGK
jgi:hypothetical protein